MVLRQTETRRVTPARWLSFLPQDAPDALFAQMEPLRQLRDAQALPMEIPDGPVPLPQLLPIAGAVAPALASSARRGM